MKNGKYIDVDGSERWFKDGKLHREDGPAVTWPNGYQAWYKNGLFHREDGPAAIYPGGYQSWWVLDNLVDPFTPEEYPLILARLLNI